ncbi:MAG TPA: hypothetical protein H9716_07780 [Candidatus Enterocloster faecavium]|mgnify:CR=1 FL=1|uniref:DUF4362 domain-containing protein n=1 Tax=Candidatus Enterocloster faecavium TaxID=2838560 RepID=A0A9D2RLF7_9FIRM|nr:hypothetical protein [Candidatus Enterocloster faecavium]
MNKLLKLSLTFGACAAILCGCTQSNIVTPSGGLVEGNVTPDMETKENIQINWEEVREVLRDEFIQPYGTYGDYVMDLSIGWDDDADALILRLPVTGNPSGDIAVSYAQDVLKACGDEIAVQDFSYTGSEEEGTYYGSYFDTHDVTVQVFPYNSEDDESTYIVNDTMKAGEQRALTALK